MKTTAKIVNAFDDPVGNWCECNNCNEMFFVPTFNPDGVYYIIKYCPKCGTQVINIKKIQLDVL